MKVLVNGEHPCLREFKHRLENYGYTVVDKPSHWYIDVRVNISKRNGAKVADNYQSRILARQVEKVFNLASVSPSSIVESSGNPAIELNLRPEEYSELLLDCVIEYIISRN